MRERVEEQKRYAGKHNDEYRRKEGTMKSRGTTRTQDRTYTVSLGENTDLGTRVRKLHKDYKKAMVMTMAGKTDAEIVKAIGKEGIDEAALKKRMSWLLRHLGVDSFEAPVLQSRPVRRALKNYWAPEFG